MFDGSDPLIPRRTRRRRAHSWGDDAVLHAHARTAIENMVTEVFGVAPGAIGRGTRGARRISNARQVAMYIAHVNCGLSLTDVGRDRTTVAHACLCVELRRDEALFDRALDLLGWAAPAMIRRPSAPLNSA